MVISSCATAVNAMKQKPHATSPIESQQEQIKNMFNDDAYRQLIMKLKSLK